MAETIKSGLAFADPAKINPYGAKEEDLSEYQQSLQDSVNALQMRYAQPNWFNVAAGFFKPQLGGFAASLGSASQAMGENLEKQRESQLPIAQMRSQLAMSKIAMGQNKTVADMEAARLKAGDPITPQYVSKLVNVAPDSPQAKAAQAELAVMQKNRELESSEINTRATQFGQALREIELNVQNHVYKTPQEYQAALATAKAAYGPREPSVVRPPDTSAVDKSGTAKAGATQPPAVQPPAVDTQQPASAPAVAAKTIGAQDFLSKAVYPNESPSGKPNLDSTAVGKGQMIQKTRQSIHDKYGMTAGPEQYEKDPAVAAAYDYANLGENHAILTKGDPNKTPTALDHRILWAMGTGDGPKILAADSTQKLKDLGLYLSTQKDGFKNNGLNPNMSVGRYKAMMQGQLWDSGIDPEAKVVFGQQNAPASEGAPAAISAAEKQPAKISWSDKSYPVPKPAVPADLDIEAKNEYLKTNTKNSTEFVNNLAAMANDSSTINRRTNLLKTAELVQDPLVQAWIARNSPTAVSKTIRDALASDSMPAFVQSITRGNHGLLPTDSPKMVSQVQKYVQNLAQEQQYANQMQAASTNKQLQLEQFSAVNPEMQPKAAMQKIAEELHKIQRLSTMPYLLEPYAASGHTIASMLNSDRVSDYNNHWSALHQALPAFANRIELPLALTHPDAYKPGFNYESLKPKGKQ